MLIIVFIVFIVLNVYSVVIVTNDVQLVDITGKA